MKIIKNIYGRVKQEKYKSRFILSRIMLVTRVCKFFTIKRDDYRLKFNPTALSASLWVDNKSRKLDEDIFKNILLKGDNVIDIGANIGTHTILSSKLVQSKGKIYSFEAHPKINKYLMKNLKINKIDNVYVYKVALLDKNEDVFFSNKYSDDQNRIISKGKIRVEGRTLDSFDIKEKIKLMKIDVEGFELEVIKGSKNILNQVENVYFENGVGEDNDKKFNEIFLILKNEGFTIGRIVGQEFEEISCEYKSKSTENILATKNKYRAKLNNF